MECGEENRKNVSSTRYYRMCYGADDNGIAGYSYASWDDDISMRKSTGNFVWTYYGGSVARSRKLQSVVAASSVKAEYIAEAKFVNEALWMRKLLNDFELDFGSIVIHADNQGAIAMSKDWKVDNTNKHQATE